LKKAKIYISDEGYGPIVRQSAIVGEFFKQAGDIKFDIQTYNHFEALKNIIPTANHVRKFNNIRWDKNIDGSPNLEKIETFLAQYDKQKQEFLNTEPVSDYDFVISDFVYEAFDIYSLKNIPVFGVAHFTWDWFFTKLFPPVMNDANLVRNWIKSAQKANHIFFPPFTPTEILNCYKKNAIEVPLIVRSKNHIVFEPKNKNPNILIIDSGSKVNALFIKKLKTQITPLTEFNFFLQETEEMVPSENVTAIPRGKLLSDYIPHMDLVIGRAGFNTISECIASRIPMMLYSEHMNPEMNENILNMNGIGFGTFIKISMLEESMREVLDNFFGGEYHSLKENLMNHDFKTNGAEVIAEYILNYKS
jgi:uncharacterized protein (TIGR00661 family)